MGYGSGYGSEPALAAPTSFPKARKPKRRGGATTTPTRKRSARRRASGRSAKPCKYGPRGPDGLCPKKPRAERFEEVVYLPEPPKPKKQAERRPTKAEQKARRRAEAAVEKAVTRGITTTATRGLQSKAGQRVVSAGARAAKYLATPVTALGGAGAAGAVGLAIAAGTAAFLGTTAILKGIRDRKERRQQAAFEAAQAIRRTRLDAEARLGRALTVAELQKIKQAFDLDNLMRKAGL